MFARHTHTRKLVCNKQRGAALIVMLVIMIMGTTTFLVSALNSSSLQIERDKKTANALAKAKEALISYAVSSENAGGSTARPGNFPCPDTDAPNTIGYGDENALCTAGAIGRLPWKTLGIPELLDDSGEPLWYALSGNFRKTSSRINSDTLGTLQIYDNSGSTLLTPAGSEAVAIVFAPRNPLPGQLRSTSSTALCATTGTTIALNLCAANYLDAASGRNNWTIGGPFIAANNSNSFNDRLIAIRTRDFMPTIEKRVAKELKAILEDYRATNGVYPFPAPFNTCTNSGNCDSDNSICRGHLPFNALPNDWGGSNALPTTAGGSSWFIDNRWYRVIYYSAGTNRLASPPAGCDPSLNVSGNNTPALFFMPGTPLGSISRIYPNNNLSWYLEDSSNQDMNDIYVSPTASSNDQLYVLP